MFVHVCLGVSLAVVFSHTLSGGAATFNLDLFINIKRLC